MNILLAKQAQNDIENYRISRHRLNSVLSMMDSIDVRNLNSNMRVRHVSEGGPDIYVFRDNGIRVFFTEEGKDIVILSIENG